MPEERSPAFRLYPRDLLADTAHMSDAAFGMYVRLLSRQWLDGSIPGAFEGEGESITDLLPPGSRTERLRCWLVVQRKFPAMPGQPGRLQNRRLERERLKQVENKQRKTEAGQKGAAARWGDSSRIADASDGSAVGMGTDGLALASASASALALALASAETPGAGPERAEQRHHTDDPLDDDDLDLPAARPPGGAVGITFSRWFYARAIERGAVPAHNALQPDRLALRTEEVATANMIVASYGVEACQAAAETLFDRKNDRTSAKGPLAARCTVAFLAANWEWLSPRSAAASSNGASDYADLVSDDIP